MKKNIRLFFLVALFLTGGAIKNNLSAQGSVTVVIQYGGYITQCCSANTVNYFCFNSPDNVNYCGQTTTCNTQNFADPVPAGNIVTQISINYYTAGCGAGSMTGTLNGVVIGTTAEANTGCPCTNTVWQVTGNNTSSYPCGITNSGYTYNYGGTESFQMCVSGGQVCMDRAEITITYAPANQANPASQPGAISGPTPVCAGTAYTYSIPPVANATGYTWTVPAGWTINSGQGTTSISATPGSSGNICVTASNLCGTSPPTCFAVTIASPSSAPATATASPNPICPGNSTTLTESGGTLGTGASFNWYTGSCGGTFVGSGTSISVSPGSTTTYYVAAVGTCNTTACASVVVTVGGTQATPGAPGGPTTVCSGSTQTYTTSGSAGATSYTWTVPSGAVINSGQGTTSISVTFGGSSGNVCVTATGACGTSSPACTAVTITTVPLAPASITGITPVCPGNENYTIGAVAGATGYTWSVAGAGGTIVAGQGTTGITANWSSAGTGTVSVTADNACGSSTPTTFTVTVNPLPTITIAATPTTICSGQTVTLTANGAVNYTWLGGTTPTTGGTVTATPGTTSTFTATGTDANNCTNFTTISITVNTPTPLNMTATSYTMCPGGSVTLGASGAVSYTWTPAGSLNNPNISNPTATPAVTTVYTVNGTDNNGCVASGSSTATVTVNTPPSVTATGGTICAGNSTGLNANGATSYTWTPAGSLNNPNISNPTATPTITTVYTVTGTDASGCNSAPVTATVVVNPLPTLTVTSMPASLCTGQTATITVSGASTYTWSANAGAGNVNATTFTISPSITDTYTVNATDVNGCSNGNQITVTVGGSPVITATASQTVICNGQSTTLTGSGATTYTWMPGTLVGTSVTVSPANTTTYTVTGDNSGCTGTQTIVVNVNQLPNVTASASTASVCASGAPITLTGNGATTYTWSANAGGTIAQTTTVNPSITTTYTVTGTTSGCDNTAQVTVNVTPNPTVSITATSNTICAGASTTLNASGATSYTWVPGPLSGPSVSVSPGATTIYTVTGDNSGCTSTQTVAVNVNQTPGISSTPSLDSSLCGNNNGGVTNVVVTGGTGPYTYQWYNGSTAIAGATTDSLTNVGPGTYSVLVTDANGCTVSASSATFTVPGTAAVTAAITPASSQGQAPLNVTFNGTSTGGATSYNWNFGNGTAGSGLNPPVVTYTAAGTYTVTMIATHGSCSAISTAVVTVDVGTSIIIPNIFSPNGDGINDDFMIVATGMKSLTCDIFNRWGSKVATLSGPNQPWDGRMANGNIASEGTYYYMISAIGNDGKDYSQHGPLTLVK